MTAVSSDLGNAGNVDPCLAGHGEARPARRRSRYVRDPGVSLALTPARLRLLDIVASYGLISLPQIVRLEVSSPKGTQRAMRALFDAGLADVVAVPRAALAEPSDANDASLLFGSAPNIYLPTRRGIRVLEAHGLADGAIPSRAYGPQNALFLRHELGIRDVRVWVERAARRLVGQSVAAWHDGPEAAIELGLDHYPRSVRPDAWFVYRLGRREGREAVLVGLLEMDRATERGERRWGEKMAAYESLFAGSRLRETTGYQSARLLVVCPDERRRDGLAEFLRRTASPELRDRCWLVARAVLGTDDLGVPAWRQPGSALLRPLVPPR